MKKSLFRTDKFIDNLKKININDAAALRVAYDSWLENEPFSKFNEYEKQYLIKKLCIYFARELFFVSYDNDFSRIDIVKKLVKLGADIKELDENGRTLISYAIDSNEKELTYFLSDQGLSLNEKDLEYFNFDKHSKLSNREKTEYILEEKSFCYRVNRESW